MAAVQNALTGTIRTELGKGPSRRARREGMIPAVIYGHGIDPVHVDLPGHEVFLIVKDSANAVINVSYGNEKQFTLVKAIQRHPVRRDILHVDLLVIREGEKVEVEVPIMIVGEPIPGTQLQQEAFSLVVTAPAISIPEHIEVNVEGLGDGHVVRVGDLTLPEGVEVDDELKERDILSVTEITENVEEEPEAEAAGEEAVEEEVEKD